MDPVTRRKRSLVGSGTAILIIGIICLVVKSSKERYSYEGNYNALLVAGVMCFVFAGICYLSAFIIHVRYANRPVLQATVIVASPGPSYYPPAPQQFGTTHNLPYPSPQQRYENPGNLPYPSSPMGGFQTPGFQQNYPQAPPYSAMPEPPPPYTESRRY